MKLTSYKGKLKQAEGILKTFSLLRYQSQQDPTSSKMMPLSLHFKSEMNAFSKLFNGICFRSVGAGIQKFSSYSDSTENAVIAETPFLYEIWNLGLI